VLEPLVNPLLIAPLLALLCLLPFYVSGGMGAGDVKPKGIS
jgi:Flp pilus assembly protein protease CpaA